MWSNTVYKRLTSYRVQFWWRLYVGLLKTFWLFDVAKSFFIISFSASENGSHTHSNTHSHTLFRTQQKACKHSFSILVQVSNCVTSIESIRNWWQQNVREFPGKGFWMEKMQTAGFQFHRKIFENFPCRLVRKESWENWHFSKLSNRSFPSRCT